MEMIPPVQSDLNYFGSTSSCELYFRNGIFGSYILFLECKPSIDMQWNRYHIRNTVTACGIYAEILKAHSAARFSQVVLPFFCWFTSIPTSAPEFKPPPPHAADLAYIPTSFSLNSQNLLAFPLSSLSLASLETSLTSNCLPYASSPYLLDPGAE